jgi:hypothetical protein
LKKTIAKLVIILSLYGCGGTVPPYEPTKSSSQHFKNEDQIKIGMTQAQVVEKWGKPRKITKIKNGKEFDEIWIYVPNWKFKNYLYFKDGILIRGDPNPEDLV